MRDACFDPIAAGANTPCTRRDMLKRFGNAGLGLALAAVPAALPVMPTRARASAGMTATVIEVLNFALTLEYLEYHFYTDGFAAPGLIPSADRAVFAQIIQHETAHIILLQRALGTDATSKPTFDFTGAGAYSDVLTNYTTYLGMAQGFQDMVLGAYKGQAVALMAADDTLTTALQIHSVEARHAAQVRRLRGQKGWITSNQTDVSAFAAVYATEGNRLQAGVDVGVSDAAIAAFDEPLTMAEVQAIAAPFMVV